MPVVENAEFGSLSFDEKDVYRFEGGIPGFEAATRFLLYEPKALAPLSVLLNLDRPDLRFYVLPLDQVRPGLPITISEEDRARLGLQPEEPPAIRLALVTWLPDGPPSANLLAPLLLHPPTQRGVQSIQFDSGYNCRHPLGA